LSSFCSPEKINTAHSLTVLHYTIIVIALVTMLWGVNAGNFRVWYLLGDNTLFLPNPFSSRNMCLAEAGLPNPHHGSVVFQVTARDEAYGKESRNAYHGDAR
jgi:hypothetical protein